MIAVALAALAVCAAGLAAAAGWALAEKRAGAARAELERERGARKVAEYERDEALGDVEKLQRRGDALEEFARDQIARLGGMLDGDGVDLLLAELAIAAEPRGRPHAATADAVPAAPARPAGPASGTGDARADAALQAGAAAMPGRS